MSLYLSDFNFQAIGSTLVKKGGLSSGDVAAKFAFRNGAVDVKFDTESNVFSFLFFHSSCMTYY